ncbi:MAG TPA: MerR family transcriptional regulator [Thermoanaerobaculia bacterium]
MRRLAAALPHSKAVANDDKKLYKIGEVCKIADVQPYVLRYWETEFPSLAPNKSGGGQRLYTRREIDTILRIKQLLYSEGFTIAGAKKKLEGEGDTPPPPRKPDTLANVKKELRAILEMLEK